MKIILSRKGFDSSYGGCPSPILPDGTLLSLPIPSIKDKTTFTDLYYDNKNLFQIITELKPRTKIKEKYTCHLDPDIRDYCIVENWTPLFGQEGASQTHLENHGISSGDIFLFFGWFRKAEMIDDELRFVKGASDQHIIWGYFQVGEMYKDFDILPKHFYHHPHATQDRFEKKKNCIYKASENLSINENLNGSGTFQYHDDLVLTQEGLSRSKWNLPDIFKTVEISHHSENSFKDGYFDSAKIGQEFIISENRMIDQWALNIINKGVKR